MPYINIPTRKTREATQITTQTATARIARDAITCAHGIEGMAVTRITITSGLTGGTIDSTTAKVPSGCWTMIFQNMNGSIIISIRGVMNSALP